jgi:hypothetical protein
VKGGREVVVVARRPKKVMLQSGYHRLPAPIFLARVFGEWAYEAELPSMSDLAVNA